MTGCTLLGEGVATLGDVPARCIARREEEHEALGDEMMVVALDDGMLRLLTNFWRTDEEEKAVDDDRLDPSGSCAGPASLGGPNTRLEVTEEDKSSLSVAMDLARAESVLRATEGSAV